MKNDLTTGAWQHNIGCPIKIVLVSTSDVVAGSNIVRHMKSILDPSLPLRVLGPIRSTHNAFQGVI